LAACHVLFVMQHPAAKSFRPHWETDPVFARLLGEAIDGGVRVHALVCDVDASAVTAVSAIRIINADTIPPSLLTEN
jgi:DNA-binding sugar fermentation-stimulating protein